MYKIMSAVRKSNMARYRECARSDVQRIATELLGEPTYKYPTEIRYGKKGSLKITTGGEHAGKVHDFESEFQGDISDLVAREKNLDARQLGVWLHARYGHQLAGSAPKSPVGSIGTDAEIGRLVKYWNQARPFAGSPAEPYLLGRLGSPFPEGFNIADLRWRSEDRAASGSIGCMVVRMLDPITGKAVGIHRTYIDQSGNRVSRSVLGHTGAIRVVPGAEGDDTMLVAEGLETTMAAQLLFPQAHAWSAVSAGGLAKFPVIAGIKRLIICADHDPMNSRGIRPGISAAHACQQRWTKSDVIVEIKTPREESSDFNDVLISILNAKKAS